jgi:eukaryotic-like serine/threonine-protein kinase
MTDFLSSLKITDKLGNGHFGEVFLGSDDVHPELAVKMIRPKSSDSPERWEQRKSDLVKEGSNLKKAAHDHVVQVHYINRAPSEDAIYLAMELCEGGSLQARYEAGPMTSGEVHKVATHVCHGLGSLHHRDMLHRDLKPGNILVDKKGTVKLGDFGLVTDDLFAGYADLEGYIYVDHQAPEAFATGLASQKTDYWALGMTLYRLLHGDAWYRASPLPRHSVMDGGHADKLTWLPHVSGKWRRLIRAMLNDDPNGRLSTSKEALNALADIATEISWECSHSTDKITWTRSKGDRRIEVVFAFLGKLASWTATSYPLTAGGKKLLDSSGGLVSKVVAERSLRKFFGT